MHLAGEAADAELQALHVGGRLDLLAVPAAHLGAGVAGREVDDVVLGVELAHQLAAVALVHPGRHLPAVQAEGNGAAEARRLRSCRRSSRARCGPLRPCPAARRRPRRRPASVRRRHGWRSRTCRRTWTSRGRRTLRRRRTGCRATSGSWRPAAIGWRAARARRARCRWRARRRCLRCEEANDGPWLVSWRRSEADHSPSDSFPSGTGFPCALATLSRPTFRLGLPCARHQLAEARRGSKPRCPWHPAPAAQQRAGSPWSMNLSRQPEHQDRLDDARGQRFRHRAAGAAHHAALFHRHERSRASAASCSTSSTSSGLTKRMLATVASSRSRRLQRRVHHRAERQDRDALALRA